MAAAKPWLASYPPDVPADIPPFPYTSLVDVFDEAVARHAHLTAFISLGKRLSYREFGELGRAFAAFLQNGLGLKPGVRLAIMLPNCLQYPVALYGALKAGLVVVNCNPLYTPRELAHQLYDSGAEVVVVLENFAHVVQQAQAMMGQTNPVQHVLVTGLGDLLGGLKAWGVNFALRHVKRVVPAWKIPKAMMFAKALTLGKHHPLRAVKRNLDDLAFLQYTGGTTGIAKGAMLSHGNMLANLEQIHAWVKSVLQPQQELIVTALPLYHIFSLTANGLLFIKLGSANLLIPNPRDIGGLIKEMARYPFTAITGVNTLFNALLQHPDFSRLNFASLRIALGGGMSLQKNVAEQWQTRTGSPLLEAYGLTETAPAVTINPLNLQGFTGSIGLPIPSTEVSIRDDAGRVLALGQEGEICVKGPQLMQGYYRRPDETEMVMTDDGYLRTGDIGVMDEQGFVRLLERKKDVILVSGFNVYPNEIEAVLATCPGVREAAAVGQPDPHSGEVVKVVIVKADPNLDASHIVAHCKENLTGYKQPKIVEFREQLPKNNVGKILRRELRHSSRPRRAGQMD